MTKEEYLQWLDERGYIGTWSLQKCCDADALIKRETMAEMRKWLYKEVHDNILREFIATMIESFYSSILVKDMLVYMNAYPEWMKMDSR